MLQIKAKKFMLFVFMCSFHFNRRQIIFRRGFLSLFHWLNKKLNEMNKHIKTLLFALLVSAGITASIDTKAQSANVSFSVFYNSLQPYGRWIHNPTYGQVWVTNVNGFSPYSTGGYWAYTDYGWTWVSNYDWGWAPFHYGRWAYDPAYGGWFWVPGYEWGPAWVAWRNNNDYYGWAPLSPGLNIGIGMSAYNSIPTNTWIFAPARYIGNPGIHRYYVPRTQNVTIINHTTVVNNVEVKNNVHYVAGPRREDVEKASHQKIETYTVANSSQPGKTVINDNTVKVYRPVLNSDNKTVVNSNNNNKAVNINNDETSVVNKNNNSNNTVVNKPVPANKKPVADDVANQKSIQQQKQAEQQRVQSTQDAKQKAQQIVNENAQQQVQQKARQQQIEEQRIQQQKAQAQQKRQQEAEQKARQQQLEQQRIQQQKAQAQQQAQQQRMQQQAQQQKAQQPPQEVIKKKTPGKR